MERKSFVISISEASTLGGLSGKRLGDPLHSVRHLRILRSTIRRERQISGGAGALGGSLQAFLRVHGD